MSRYGRGVGILLTTLALLLSGLDVVEANPAIPLADPASASVAPSQSAVQVPELTWLPAPELERAWAGIASQGDLAAQEWALRHSVLTRAACPDLVDLRTSVAGPAFAWRDQYRGRSHVRPALARVFWQARQKFRAEHPEAIVSLGDLAQPGCGQIAYGTLVRMLRDEPGQPGDATRMLAQVRPVLGAPMVVQWLPGRDFPLERERFRNPDEPILVEQRLIGVAQDASGATVVRVATRRYAEPPAPKKPRKWKRTVQHMLKDVKSLWTHGRLVRQELVATTLQGGTAARRWLLHRVDAAHKRQLVIVATKRPGQTFSLDGIEELRLSRWQPHKPESFRGEVRWLPQVGGEGQGADGQRLWRRWKVLIEADHLSHMTGRDADVAFITHDNKNLHKVALKDLDAQASWRWLELLVQTGQELGTPVEHILVAKSIKRTLLRKLGKSLRESTLWRDVLVEAKGHDDHFHLRLTQPSAAADAQALVALKDAAGHGAVVATAPRP
jgi:hypothetical protein